MTDSCKSQYDEAILAVNSGNLCTNIEIMKLSREGLKVNIENFQNGKNTDAEILSLLRQINDKLDILVKNKEV